MKAFVALFKTELKLSLRGGDMLFFGILFPVGVMLLLGFISGAEATKLAFGGVAAIGICASGLMGLPLTFAGYRHEKILKRFRVTPVSPLKLLLAVALLQSLFAIISGLTVSLIAGLVFDVEISGGLLRYVLTFLFVQFSIFGIGFLVAALVPNSKTANLVCTIIYFPMLFLSGATVPYEIMPPGLRIVADVFPLTQGIKLLKSATLGTPLTQELLSLLVLAGIAVISFAVAIKTFRWE